MRFPAEKEKTFFTERRSLTDNSNVSCLWSYEAELMVLCKTESMAFPSGIRTNTENQFEELFPLSKNPKLGIEYTLARGASVMCFAVDNPTGHNNFLKYKAADDFLSFQKLLQKRIIERENLLSTISTIDNAIIDSISDNQFKFMS